ncbi:hypothetical protein MKX01_032738, partial [Papaver californicum]
MKLHVLNPGLCLPSFFNIKILSWNCRGIARPSFVRVIKKLIKRHNLYVALFETRVLEDHVSDIVSKLGFTDSTIVNPHGFCGGLCLLWNSSKVDIQTTSKSRWAIHVVVTVKFQQPWILSFLYDSTNKINRKRMWNELEAISEIPNAEWL